MQLIIAEKPSLARNIVDAINGLGKGNMKKNAGFYEGCGYIVTWAFGHLFSLSDIEYYTEKENYDPSKKVSWKMENLPCFPHKYNFSLRVDDTGKADSGVAQQFEIIKTLCNRSDVDTVINAGDADREGEIIVRLCISKSGIEDGKKLKRLWLPDQTAETIRSALKNMKNSSEYDLLAHEGYARTFVDWLYGTNLTRYATLKSGAFLRVGRVIVPIVKAIYDRDMAIKNFVPEPYYAIISKEKTGGEEIELVSKSRFDKDSLKNAEELCKDYNERTAVVTSVKKKKTTLAPGKLYSLTKLQNVLSRKYKMPMNESLEIAQRLYEKGYLTYPRTNSEYLATAEKDKMKQIIASVSRLGYKVKFKEGKSIFDDSKIEAHSALTPTYKIPDKNVLTEKESLLYSTVIRRFVAVFCAEDCVVNKTDIVITLGDNCEEFTFKGMAILEKGWTAYDDCAQKDKILPDLKKGDLIEHVFKPVEKTTSPPKHYTVETLNNYLKNPFKEDKASISAAVRKKTDLTDSERSNSTEDSENDEEDYKAIFEGLELGTEATRTGIIENARQSGYINLNKDVYTILPKGEYLIETLSLLSISMDKYKTSMLGQALKKVYKGQISIRQCLKLAEHEIAFVFGNNVNGQRSKQEDIGIYGDEVGICPICGKSVKRDRYGYGCSGYKEGCKLRIPLSLCKRLITLPIAKLLLETGKAENIDGFISKAGKKFSATLKLEEGKVTFDFGNRKA